LRHIGLSRGAVNFQAIIRVAVEACKSNQWELEPKEAEARRVWTSGHSYAAIAVTDDRWRFGEERNMGAIQRLQHTSVPMTPGGHGEARRFYAEVLGMEEIPTPSDLSNLSLVWFRASSDGQELHCFATDHDRFGSPDQHLCLQVDDLSSFSERLVEHGIKIEEAQRISSRPRCFVRDPFGNLIELTQIDGEYG
jgi:extradiol dioxygenase family protein